MSNAEQRLEQLRAELSAELLAAVHKTIGPARSSKPRRKRPPTPAGVDPDLFAKAVAGDWRSAQEVRQVLEKAAPIAPHLPVEGATGVWQLVIGLEPGSGAVLGVKQNLVGVAIPDAPGKISTVAGGEDLPLTPEQLEAVRKALAPLLGEFEEELEEEDPVEAALQADAKRMRELTQARSQDATN